MTDVMRDFNHGDGYLFSAARNSSLLCAPIFPQNGLEEIFKEISSFQPATVQKRTAPPPPPPALQTLQPINDLLAEQMQRIRNPQQRDQKKVYYCQRCLNHHRLEPRKNHKCECPFANCDCEFCILVEKRRKLNSKLHDLDIGTAEEPLAKVDSEDGQKQKGERIPNCQKCGQHGRKSRLKGHKRVCPYKECKCPKCEVVTERQKLMADQIKIRRKQKKDKIMNYTRDQITSTLNAAAAFSAAGLQLPFNAFFYNQLKSVPSSLLTSPASSDGSSYSPQSQLGSAFSAPTASPEILKVPLVSPSPPSPTQPGIVAPVAINPSTPTVGTTFPFPIIPSEALLSLLATYNLLDQNLKPETMDCTNPIIDVCSV